MENEKIYTLKSVTSELKKLEKSKQKKKEAVQKLTASMKEDSQKIKELEGIYDRLYNQNLHSKIEIAWFRNKSKRLTGEQIEKILLISTQTRDDLDILDVPSVVHEIKKMGDAKRNEMSGNITENEPLQLPAIPPVAINITTEKKEGVT